MMTFIILIIIFVVILPPLLPLIAYVALIVATYKIIKKKNYSFPALWALVSAFIPLITTFVALCMPSKTYKYNSYEDIEERIERKYYNQYDSVKQRIENEILEEKLKQSELEKEKIKRDLSAAEREAAELKSHIEEKESAFRKQQNQDKYSVLRKYNIIDDEEYNDIVEYEETENGTN